MFQARFTGYNEALEQVSTKWEKISDAQVQALVNRGFDFDLGYTYCDNKCPLSLLPMKEADTDCLEVRFLEE